LQHKGMAAIGENVSMTATIKSFDGKILICDIEAIISGSDFILCKGTQTQIILNKEIIEQLISNAYKRTKSQ
jgi:predicted thioesterase